MWAWVSFAIGFFLGMSTGIFVIAMLKHCSPPERHSDYEAMTPHSKDSLRAGFFTEGKLPMPPGKVVALRSSRSQLN